MQKFILVATLFAFISCRSSKKEINLPGKIAVEFRDSCFIYDNSNLHKSAFKIRGSGIRYGGFRWKNSIDHLMGVEFFETALTGTNRGNIVCFDLSGNIIDRIYESRDGEITGYPYLSRNDKRVLFTTEEKGDVRLNPFEGLSREQSLVIMDVKQKSIEKKIEKIGLSSNLELYESPWLYDEDRFIYSITGEKKIITKEVTVNRVQTEEPGIYIYDVVTDRKELLVPGARFGICSPTGLQVLFIKNQSVWMLDLKDNSRKIIYKGASKDRINNIHWTPDGRYIYIASAYYYEPSRFKSEEKLIELATGKEVPFKKIGHAYLGYTWK